MLRHLPQTLLLIMLVGAAGACTVPRAAVLAMMIQEPSLRPPQSTPPRFDLQPFVTGSGGLPRAALTTTTPVPMDAVAAYYQRALPGCGWKFVETPVKGNSSQRIVARQCDRSPHQEYPVLGLELDVWIEPDPNAGSNDADRTQVRVEIIPNDLYTWTGDGLIYRLAMSAGPWPSPAAPLALAMMALW